MKSSLKTIVMWLIIGIICVVLISAILENSDTKMSYITPVIFIFVSPISKTRFICSTTKFVEKFNFNKRLFFQFGFIGSDYST